MNYEMQKKKWFHESYFPHNCAVVTEKDVLYVDIPGSGCLIGFKRWFHDLFLLSTSFDYARGFYNSTNAMRLDRLKHFREYKSRIHPLSKFMVFWETFILLVFVCHKYLYRISSTILLDKLPISIYYLGVFLEGIFAADLIINLMKGHVDKEMKLVILNYNDCLMRYCSTKLFIHVISLLPVHCLMFIMYESDITCGPCKANYFNCILKMLNAFNLYRIFEMSTIFIEKYRSSEWIQFYRFLRITLLGLMTMIQFFELAEVIGLVKILQTGMIDVASAFSKIILIRYSEDEGIPKSINSNTSMVRLDMARLLKALLRLTFVNYDFDLIAKVTSVFSYFIAAVFYVWALLECYSMFIRLYYGQDKLLCSKKYVENMLEAYNVDRSEEMMEKIDQYFSFKPTRTRILHLSNGLYKSIPRVLKYEARLHYNSRFLYRIPLFKRWPIALMEDLVLLLKSEIYLPHAVVAEAGSEGNGLMIVDLGVLAVYSAEEVETGHLIDGDYFGEVSLFTDNEIMNSYIIAVDTCKILILDKYEFRKCMRQYSRLFFEMRKRFFKGPNEENKVVTKVSKISPDSTQDKYTEDVKTAEGRDRSVV